jgi:hypothetical protein
VNLESLLGTAAFAGFTAAITASYQGDVTHSASSGRTTYPPASSLGGDISISSSGTTSANGSSVSFTCNSQFPGTIAGELISGPEVTAVSSSRRAGASETVSTASKHPKHGKHGEGSAETHRPRQRQGVARQGRPGHAGDKALPEGTAGAGQGQRQEKRQGGAEAHHHHRERHRGGEREQERHCTAHQTAVRASSLSGCGELRMPGA